MSAHVPQLPTVLQLHIIRALQVTLWTLKMLHHKPTYTHCDDPQQSLYMVAWPHACYTQMLAATRCTYTHCANKAHAWSHGPMLVSCRKCMGCLVNLSLTRVVTWLHWCLPAALGPLRLMCSTRHCFSITQAKGLQTVNMHHPLRILNITLRFCYPDGCLLYAGWIGLVTHPMCLHQSPHQTVSSQLMSANALSPAPIELHFLAELRQASVGNVCWRRPI